jgi:hypothetical protein
MTTHVDPRREHFDAFEALPRDTPILMLNLIRLRVEADYADAGVAPAARRMRPTAARVGRSSRASAAGSCGAGSPSRW